MILEGNLIKMRTLFSGEVQYFLDLSGHVVDMNELLGKKISMEFKNEINCIKCGRKTKTSFAQGYCYPCFISAPETEECVLRPELCRAHEGVARDMHYAENHCLIDHYVYMAVSGGLKVGVTRQTQLYNRWIDQGAWKAIKLAITPNRFIAGCIEVALKQSFSDKTNWRHMLTNKRIEIDILEEKDRALDLLGKDLQKYATDDDEITEINYPVLTYPQKARSLNLMKNPFVEGILTGIKGQYLLFDSGSALNIRKHNGFKIRLGY